MSVLTPARRAELEEELAGLEAAYTATSNAYIAACNRGVKSYKFDSGEGSQSATSYSPRELHENMERLRSQINSLKRVLTGGHLRQFKLNRKPCR